MEIKTGLLAGVRGLALSLLAMLGSLVLFILFTLSVSFISLGIGVFTTPVVARWTRAHANLRRRLAAEWSGVEIAVPYRPEPETESGLIGQMQRCRWILKDPATWRDLLWELVDSTAGYALATLTFGLIAQGAFGAVLAAGVWRPIANHGSGEWYGFVHVTSQGRSFMALALGLVFIATAVRCNPAILRAHANLTRVFLAPDHERSLELRVERLTETRADAVDTSAAELRRIERDLHDGAQARLVAMGMNLGAVEALLERDPQRAKALLAEARQSSADALHELRDLVRGIHPPVLAERGLGDAVRALALRSPIPTEVTVDLPGRLDAPVESAAYFAVSEVLTNAIKHAGSDHEGRPAAGHIWIDLRHEGGMLRLMVTDDGPGGATLSPGRSEGSGLRGIERRLGTFDGVLVLSSPPGGPTIVTMELPCALTAPKAASS